MLKWVLYILTSIGCHALQTLVENMFFNVFYAEKIKKDKNKEFAAKFAEKFDKKCFFLNLHHNASGRFFPSKRVFSTKKH